MHKNDNFVNPLVYCARYNGYYNRLSMQTKPLLLAILSNAVI